MRRKPKIVKREHPKLLESPTFNSAQASGELKEQDAPECSDVPQLIEYFSKMLTKEKDNPEIEVAEVEDLLRPHMPVDVTQLQVTLILTMALRIALKANISLQEYCARVAAIKLLFKYGLQIQPNDVLKLKKALSANANISHGVREELIFLILSDSCSQDVVARPFLMRVDAALIKVGLFTASSPDLSTAEAQGLFLRAITNLDLDYVIQCLSNRRNIPLILNPRKEAVPAIGEKEEKQQDNADALCKSLFDSAVAALASAPKNSEREQAIAKIIADLLLEEVKTPPAQPQVPQPNAEQLSSANGLAAK